MKKRINYGQLYTTKGIAYVRHHIGDRLISDKIVADRDEFNEKFWNSFQNSNCKTFFEFLQNNLTAVQLKELTANDKRQIVWTTGIVRQAKTSCLIVMLTKNYKKLDSLSVSDTYYACYSSKNSFTSSGDIFINFFVPEK